MLKTTYNCARCLTPNSMLEAEEGEERCFYCGYRTYPGDPSEPKPDHPLLKPKTKGRCTGPECDRTVTKKDLCEGHYKQLYRGVALTPITIDNRGRPRSHTEE